MNKSVQLKLVMMMLILSIALSCDEENGTTSTTLNGKWVEINSATDTLTFGYLGDLETMTLSRGKEYKNGFLLPKSNSGPYEYTLSPDKISLRWFLSSNSAFHDYYFNQAGNKIVIGNFYEASSLGKKQTFRKLR